MASLPDSNLEACFQDAPPDARDVARGVTRLFFRQDMYAICEVPLPNGRRADMAAIDGRGFLTIVEIKVSRADLIGDAKWTDYLDYCDYFYWAVPAALAHEPSLSGQFGEEVSGVIVADRYDAAIMRPSPCRPLAAARRKAETLRFARRAARRLSGQMDPGLAGLD